MSYKLKTLIVFDTNSLRSTDGGEVVYSSFSFGKAYDIVNEFITVNNLHDDIHIAVSAMVIDEIKVQMQRSYSGDIQKLQDTKRRLSGLPHIADTLIGIPDLEFNCEDHVEQKTQEYLAANGHVRLMTYEESSSNHILKSLIDRAHKTKPPFFRTTKNSDAGFKDSVIWETLMNFSDIANYQKVILVTKDDGFKGCDKEFIAKWNKHFKIIADPTAVNNEIAIDYENYIKERAIHDYTQKDYFKDYLNDELKVLSTITIDDNDFAIDNFQLTDLCNYVERMLPNEEGEENIIIHSVITIHYTQEGEKKTHEVKAKITLSDDFAKSIISIEYDIDLE